MNIGIMINMTEKDLTINELHSILTDLIEKGQGNSEFRLSLLRYDIDYPYATIPKRVDPIIGFDDVLFTDNRPATFKKIKKE